MVSRVGHGSKCRLGGVKAARKLASLTLDEVFPGTSLCANHTKLVGNAVCSSTRDKAAVEVETMFAGREAWYKRHDLRCHGRAWLDTRVMVITRGPCLFLVPGNGVGSCMQLVAHVPPSPDDL
jgi:hypothetical protein